MARRLWRWLVRTGFRLLYNELAWTYDAVSWVVSLGEWRKWQLAAVPFVQGERVLEIAHGPGHMLLALEKRGKRATGIDLSPTMGRMAARRLRRAGQLPALVRGVAQALPFRAESFDTVLSTFPTYFVAERRTMEAVYRVLSPGGRYIIVPEGHLRGSGPVQRFIAWLFRITGQSDGVFAAKEERQAAETPEWCAFRLAMEQTGFSVQAQQVMLAHSAATVVIATREPAPGSGHRT